MEKQEINEFSYSPGSIVKGVIIKENRALIVEVEVGAEGTFLTKWELLETARAKLRAQKVELVLSESKCTDKEQASLVDTVIIRYQEAPPEQIAELIKLVEETPQAQEVDEKKRGLFQKLFG